MSAGSSSGSAAAVVESGPRYVGRRAVAAIALLLALALAAVSAPALAAPAKPPQLDARAWTLVDARDGEQLAGKAAARPLPIASATKLMTAYLAMRDLEPDQMVAAPAYSAAPAESVLGLGEGERISVRDLLVAMMLPSANDAAAAVATEVSGSIPRFVVRMNGAARKLGLDDTSFANPIGLDDPLNVSSARDLAALTRVLREDERFRTIVAKQEATLRSGRETRRVSSRNTLLGSDPSVDGVKTGHTRGAGYVLVASAERKGVELVSVVLGAPSEGARDAESERLLDYGFSLYEPRQVVRRSEELGQVAVSHEDEALPLVAARGVEVTAREGQSIRTTLLTPDSVEGPIEAGERVGRGVVSLDGETVGSAPLLAARDVAAPGPLEDFGGALPVALVAGGSILMLIAVVSAARRGSSRPRAPTRRSDQEVNSRRRRREVEGEET